MNGLQKGVSGGFALTINLLFSLVRGRGKSIVLNFCFSCILIKNWSWLFKARFVLILGKLCGISHECHVSKDPPSLKSPNTTMTRNNFLTARPLTGYIQGSQPYQVRPKMFGSLAWSIRQATCISTDRPLAGSFARRFTLRSPLHTA